MNKNCVKAVALGGVAMIASALWGCSDEEKGLTTIDLIGNLNHEDVGDLDDLFEVVEVINPELTDSSMLKSPLIGGFSDGIIYIAERGTDTYPLMAFDVKTGKCLASFDHKGRGPGEYILYYDPVFQGNPGSWTGLDTYLRRVTRYTVDGELIKVWPEMKITSLHPEGDGWIAQNNDLSRDRDDPMQLIRFDSDFNPTDTIELNLEVARNTGPGIMPTEDGLQIFTADTIYSLADVENPKPILAFNLGDARLPLDNPGFTSMKERFKYMYYFFFRFGDYMYVDNKLGDRNVIQVYDMRDGKVLYSRSSRFNPDTYQIIEGDNGTYFTVDGVKSRWWFMYSTTGDIFILQNAEDVDEDTSNPKIARLRIKKR